MPVYVDAVLKTRLCPKLTKDSIAELSMKNLRKPEPKSEFKNL